MVQPRPLWGNHGEERPLVGPFIVPEAQPCQAPRTGWALLPGGASQPAPTRCHCSFPSSVISWSLGDLALVPTQGWRGALVPTPPPPCTSPFTCWHQSRGNAGQQLGTGAQLCPPPFRPTSERGEEQAASKKPLQDGALEILSTNYESRDKRDICKSISERTFPGKSFIPAGSRQGHILSLLLPLPCSEPTQGSASLSVSGLTGHEGPRARQHSAEVSWRSL